MIFDANIIGSISSVYEKSRASVTNCTLCFREERSRTIKRRNKLQEIEREARICRVTEIAKGRASRSLKGNILTLRQEIEDMNIGDIRDIKVERRDYGTVGSGMPAG